MKELYRTVRDFPNYRVTDAGRVFCYRKLANGEESRSRLRAPSFRGHPTVCLCGPHGRITVRVSKLVWFSFKTNKSILSGKHAQFSFKDGNPENCALDNLELNDLVRTSGRGTWKWWRSLSKQERIEVMEMWLRLKG